MYVLFIYPRTENYSKTLPGGFVKIRNDFLLIDRRSFVNKLVNRYINLRDFFVHKKYLLPGMLRYVMVIYFRS